MNERLRPTANIRVILLEAIGRPRPSSRLPYSAPERISSEVCLNRKVVHSDQRGSSTNQLPDRADRFPVQGPTPSTKESNETTGVLSVEGPERVESGSRADPDFERFGGRQFTLPRT